MTNGARLHYGIITGYTARAAFVLRKLVAQREVPWDASWADSPVQTAHSIRTVLLSRNL